MCVAENAVDSHILETDDLEDNANSPLDVHNYNLARKMAEMDFSDG